MITLAITPLRQLTGQPVLVRFRRMLGLYAFFYATLHFTRLPGARPARLLDADLRGDRQASLHHRRLHRVAAAGAAGDHVDPAAIRRLGRNWARLHRLVYAIGVLAVLHFWWLVKSDMRDPALYAGDPRAAARLARVDRRAAGSARSARAVQQQQAERGGEQQRRQQQPGHAAHRRRQRCRLAAWAGVASSTLVRTRPVAASAAGPRWALRPRSDADRTPPGRPDAARRRVPASR